MLTALAAPLTLALALVLDDAADARFVLQGKVLDPTRAPVSAARVTAVSSDLRSSPTALTDVNGEFKLAVPPGTYTLTVKASGFLEVSQTMAAGVEGSDNREFVLTLAPFGESVTVSSAAGYQVDAIGSGTRTLTALRDLPQSVTVTTRQLIRDQLMLSIGDVMRYTPGIQAHQGENNRDQIVVRGNSSSADFFLNGVRDDVQYYRDLYNVERVEALKGPNAMMFGRGGGGGVVNRVTREAIFRPVRDVTVQGGAYGHKRIAGDVDQPLNDKVALRLTGMYESSDSFRDYVGLERYAVNPTVTLAASPRTRVTLGYEHLHDTRVADRGITSFEGRPADVDVSTYYGNPADSHVRAAVDLAHRHRRAQGGRPHAPQPHPVRRLRPLLPELRAGRGHGGQEPRGPHGLQQRHAAPERLQPDGPRLPSRHRPREAHPARGLRAGPPEHGQLQEHRVLRRHGHQPVRAATPARRSALPWSSARAPPTPTTT